MREGRFILAGHGTDNGHLLCSSSERDCGKVDRLPRDSLVEVFGMMR